MTTARISFFHGSGLFYTIRRIMGFVTYLESKGYQTNIYIDPDKSFYGEQIEEPYKSIGNVWEYYFKNVIPPYECIDIDDRRKYRDIIPLTSVRFTERDFISKYMAPQEWTLRRQVVDNETVGIHIRRGDASARSPILPCKFYFEQIDGITDGKIFLSTDSSVVAKSFANRYKERLVCLDHHRYVPGFRGSFHATFKGHGGEFGRQVVADYLNLRACKTLLTMQSSISIMLAHTNECMPLLQHDPLWSKIISVQRIAKKRYSLLEEAIEECGCRTADEVLAFSEKFVRSKR